jgi:hypothetical protein
VLGGIAGLAATPVAPAPTRARSRRGWIAGIATVLVVVVLGVSAYGIYASFLRPSSQVDGAKNLPDTTLFYASVDLVAAANNSHHINFSDLGQGAGAGSGSTGTGIGLDWQKDVLPWVGPTVTAAVIPGSGSAMVEVALLQSHDDAAATSAVQKALAAQQQHGTSFTTSSYSSFTLHSAAGAGTTVATGSGWVILSSTAAGARTVIDRIDGKGATLFSTSSFQQATGSLPSGRFGTVYVNLHALASKASAGVGALSAAVLSVYPTAAGSLAWTPAGLRWQMTLQAAQGGFPQQNVSGATTDLATLVPSNATVYSGVANLGGLTQSLAELVAPTGQATPDPLKAALGIAATDPALQQRAAFALLPGATGSTATPGSGVFLLHVASDADAARVLNQLAQHANLTTSATTVDGQAATQLLSANGAGAPLGLGPTADLTRTTQTLTTAPQVVAVEAVVHNTMVIATSATSLQAVIETAKGSSGSLAQAAAFHQLVASAPANAAATAYVNVAGLQQLLHVSTSALKVQATGALVTLVWNNTELQTTIDSALNP